MAYVVRRIALIIGEENTMGKITVQTKGDGAGYAYSIKTTRVAETDFPYEGQKLGCTADLVAFARNLQSLDIEKMLCLYMDAGNKLICVQIMTGTVNQCVVYPREVLRHALLTGACGIILVHNHPSGQVKPSDADIHMTTQLRDLGKALDLIVHDHVIMAGDKFFSFREAGLVF